MPQFSGASRRILDCVMRGLVGADVRFIDRERLEEFQILRIPGI
jgi:hypothetical protein